MVQRTIVIPTSDNDGRPLTAVISDIESEMLRLTGGFSVSDTRGVWRGDDGTIYRDRSQTYTLISDERTDQAISDRLSAWASDLRQEALFTATTANVNVAFVAPAAVVAA